MISVSEVMTTACHCAGMTERTHLDVIAVAQAILRATNEHGRPNTFSPGELASSYGAPRPIVTGRILSRYPVSVWQHLGGHEQWGSCPRYDQRRVAV